mmetsp:Transcript_89314/g.257632  ORF Transcript_89314/g.257632 Transcript_89314/m.257632 type:complete len:255 (-) Transcript_89314:72-836(-)
MAPQTARAGARTSSTARRRAPAAEGKRKAAAESASGASFAVKRKLPRREEEAVSVSVTESATPLSDDVVAAALSLALRRRPCAPKTGQVRELMRLWAKPILKTRIPGAASANPTLATLDAAKQSVLRFYAREEAQGDQSDVAKAFYLATGERRLRFDWASARRRVLGASFDMDCKVDTWTDCLAMTSGVTNACSEIYICGTKKVTKRALTSLLCHEGLHNLARRTRPGNSFLSEDIEHMAMALLGDPQLVHHVD